MDLVAFFTKTKMTRRELASRMGVHPARIIGLVRGDEWPSLKTAMRVYDATSGLVTPFDLAAVCTMAEQRRREESLPLSKNQQLHDEGASP